MFSPHPHITPHPHTSLPLSTAHHSPKIHFGMSISNFLFFPSIGCFRNFHFRFFGNFSFFFVPLVCGLISTLSLPPYNFFYLNFISFPFLLLFYLRLEIKKSFSSFLYGWIFGFAYFVSNIYWIANSLTFEEIFKKERKIEWESLVSLINSHQTQLR